MYLKQIEIHGFKSFANNTVLTFEPGITGIVGPNGSGKSNIADAVRWVLGERSMKQLRGGESLDVIFSGTEHRKAQSFAYVSLIIDNSDKKLPISYDEVQVSRQLNRNGESEYKLNNTECRLKDIIEVFYDTGIGKEGYSIIGQGQIDKILSNKPEDRRELFDEAVGIVKYKRRKIIAEKKLEEERLNLSRVTDIISEIERRIGPLKKQADAAKEYIGLRDELILYESNNFIREVDSESKFIEDTKIKIDDNSVELKKVRNERTEFDNKYNDLENSITILDSEISEIKNSIFEKMSLIGKNNGEVNVIKEQINSENQFSKTRNERIEILNKNIDSYIKQIKNDLKILYVIKKQVELVRTTSTDFEVDSDNTSNDSKIINEAIENTNNVILTYFEKNKLDEFKFEENSDIFSSDDDFINLDKEKKELNDIDEKISIDNKEIVTLLSNLDKSNLVLKKLNNDIIKQQNLFHTEESRYDSLKNMLEKYEGFTNVVKKIFDVRSKFKGIRGVVADIIETEKKYEIAIEIALGNSLQHIVTDTIDTSKEIINYVKENKLGRVTTLPLDSIKLNDNEIYLKAIKEKGVIDIASNLVTCDKKYDELNKYLLSRCLVIDTFDNAKRIFIKYNSGLKLVTIDGELFNPGGAVSGGAYKNSSTLIGRKRELDELNILVQKLKNEVDKLTSERNNITETINNIISKKEKLKDELNALNIKKNTVNLNIINNIKLQYSSISNKAQYTSTDLEKLCLNLKDSFEEKNKYNDDNLNLVSVLNEKEEKIKYLEKIIVDLNSEVAELENIVKIKQDEKKLKLSSRKEVYESKDRIITRQIELDQEINKLETSLEKSTNHIEEMTNYMMENYEISYATAKEKYDENLGSVDDIKEKVKEQRKIVKDLGPINLNAIEEFEKEGERHILMTTQYEDIKKSEEMIKGIVNELDENMRKQFDENFSKIKFEFENVFKILFGGGEANLELVETEDASGLDAGVSIVVQPPGKKLGNMMQLSGGEKALTAIALLFAIQNLKPSPFCLLDEIEAALDESNVDRFADYLHNLTDNTQFIIITHRRGTMEKADRLYGITMEEKGITKLVSVDLIEEEMKNEIN